MDFVVLGAFITFNVGAMLGAFYVGWPSRKTFIALGIVVPALASLVVLGMCVHALFLDATAPAWFVPPFEVGVAITAVAVAVTGVPMVAGFAAVKRVFGGKPRRRPVETLDDADCEQCGYPLRGLSERRCPECGTPFDPERLTARKR